MFDGGESGRVGSAYVGDALINLFHGVLVGVGLCIKASVVLDNSKSSRTFFSQPLRRAGLWFGGWRPGCPGLLKWQRLVVSLRRRADPGR